MASRVLLLLSLTALLIFSAVSPSFSADVDDEEDLSFLEDPKEEVKALSKPLTDDFEGGEDDDDDDEEDGEHFSDLASPDSGPFPAPGVDEKDVVVIKERNFTDVIENNEYVMVEFYAPWCGHCQSLAPEYAAAATELKGDGVVLAKIDATVENELAHQYSVQGFPTILFFVDGEHKPYTGGRTNVFVLEVQIFGLIFVSVDVDNEDYGKPVAEYFGVSSSNAPKLVAFTGNEDPQKHYFDGEIKSDNIKIFGEEFLSDKLKPFYKSDPIPEKNDGDVKIVVGDNFDEIVLDESKDVLLEVYAPWCGHCQALEPMYNKLAKHLSSIDSIVIAKMDGTTNEHPKAKAEGFPTILFFPAGNKTSSEPITVDADRTVVAFYKFMRKHATIPFKLEKPAASTESPKATESTSKVETTETKGKPESTTKSTESDSKDEL
ncbi:hypothetical protein F2Q69_00019221 [Brassica cretica]|uniref:protein disulfide-isomerase n=1 Tax=Brassica cretica TaxID=69181 RepID=A0A8S9QFF7_BRACR|nr:hypothetical protein F2Q69_00019221 [Brassica cretica]